MTILRLVEVCISVRMTTLKVEILAGLAGSMFYLGLAVKAFGSSPNLIKYNERRIGHSLRERKQTVCL
jgi:hypothetical protein